MAAGELRRVRAGGSSKLDAMLEKGGDDIDAFVSTDFDEGAPETGSLVLSVSF